MIEVLIALVLLAIAGTALVVLLGQTASSMQQLTLRERAQLGATRRLDRIAAMPRSQLAARVGKSFVDGWVVQITAEGPGLFGVDVAESDTTPTLAQTTFYRPDTSHATQ